MKTIPLWLLSILSVVLMAEGTSQGQGNQHVTFTKDVAPILQRSCENCHRPNGVGPMSLSTYEAARPWASVIKLKTAVREMPPWYIDKRVGIQKFKDDPSLSDEEIATIAAWVDGGAPRGDPADMPPPHQYPPAGVWTLGEPDLVVSSPVVTVKAVWPDEFLDLGEVPTELSEDRYIKSFEVREFRPDGSRAESASKFVIHHAQVGAVPPEGGNDEAGTDLKCKQEPRNGGPGTLTLKAGDCFPEGLFEFTFNVGMNPFTYPDDLGIKLHAGEKIYFPSVHLHSNGEETNAQIQVGFWFHDRDFKPKYPRGVARAPGSLSLNDLDIPAGMDNIRHDSMAVMPMPARMLDFEPHLHSSGKRQCMEAIYPNGEREMLACANYNHNWVKAYVFQEDVAPLIPAGTILHLIGWYDNSAGNPRNIDPRNWKGQGGRTVDDMFQSSSEFLYMTQEEFDKEVADRAAKHGMASSQNNQQ